MVNVIRSVNSVRMILLLYFTITKVARPAHASLPRPALGRGHHLPLRGLLAAGGAAQGQPAALPSAQAHTARFRWGRGLCEVLLAAPGAPAALRAAHRHLHGVWGPPRPGSGPGADLGDTKTGAGAEDRGRGRDSRPRCPPRPPLPALSLPGWLLGFVWYQHGCTFIEPSCQVSWSKSNSRWNSRAAGAI